MRRVSLLILSGLLALALLAGVLVGRFALAETSGTPGTETDPLVSKSYVDLYAQWQIVNLEPGQRLMAQAGAEIILRAGKACVIASPAGGLADVTAGRDLGQGLALVANHLLIVPRSDGRGVEALTRTVLMVRGAFTIQ